MAEKELACSVNYSGCKNEADYVCHHCGRPLCSSPNCCKWGWDSAFAGLPIAHHCPDCDHIQGVGLLMRNVIDQSNQFFEGLSKEIRSLKNQLKDKRKKGKRKK
jgi:hypothetical protein